MASRASVLLLLPLLVMSVMAQAPSAESVASDRNIVRAAGVETDAAGLLKYFRSKTITPADRAKVNKLIKELGHEDFDVREKAAAELVRLGSVARGQLVEAARSKDAEVMKRAREALSEIGRGRHGPVLSAAARLLGHLKPAGAVEVLLAYLPDAEEPEVVEEVVQALSAAGVKAGKADALIVKAASDASAVRRAAAGEVLARAGKAHREDAHKMLADRDATVRRMVATALVESKDKQGVPALIELLTVPGQAEAVEDVLMLVGGETSPIPPTGNDPARRERYRKDWESWWKSNEAKVDLAKVEMGARHLGYTMVAYMDMRPGVRIRQIKLVEIDSAGKQRWVIENVGYPVFAQVTKRDRVVIAESNFNRISERSLKGEIIWQKPVAGVLVGAQRLKNGNLLVVTRNQLIEMDREGNQMGVVTRAIHDIIAAQRDKDGNYMILTSSQQCIKLDRTGREMSSFRVGQVAAGLGTNFQLLPRGHVLVPEYSNNRVVEYDSKGVVKWQASVAQPGSVRRLPNGNTLVSARIQRRVIELDKDGREKWSKNFDGYVYFADRR